MKFYKITNKEENHGGMQYEDGLNEDIIPFNPSGDCLSGGIYFSREDILSFLNYGPWIREVTLPENEEVYENPGKPKKWKSHRVILGERRRIDLDVIKELVEQGANIYDSIIILTSRYGHLELMKCLVEHGADIHSNDDSALIWASANGHLEVVKYLVEQGADVHAVDDCALKWAAEYGHLEIVKHLVEQGANVHADDDAALRLAGDGRCLDVVEYLSKYLIV